MADKQLIIDDDYCNAIAEYYVKQGAHLDSAINEYIRILKEIRLYGITDGEVAKALSNYISYAEKLKEQMGNISKISKTHVTNFLNKVDRADKYLF